MIPDNALHGKKILIGVTGGIAAYKALDLISMLRKSNATVKVVMTSSSIEFVNPMSFEALSGNPVYTQMFARSGQWEIDHISLAKWADLIAVVPATANILGKVNHGIADDLLTTVIMASKATVLFAPAMNTQMYNNPIVKENIDSLTNKGYLFLSPVKGRLACGDWGDGKLADITDIYEEIKRNFTTVKDMSGLRVLVTAGPTREYIDPARFISNPSTGKMGYAIAQAVIERGAECYLVSGPTNLDPPDKAAFFSVETADQMYKTVMSLFPDCDLLFKAAAVSDYRPAEFLSEKIKKDKTCETLQLVLNPDILKEAGKMKKNQVIIGFAAETNDIEKHATQKMESKNLDFILANDISRPDSGFGTDTNSGVLFARTGEKVYIPIMTKKEFAHRLLDEVLNKLNNFCSNLR